MVKPLEVISDRLFYAIHPHSELQGLVYFEVDSVLVYKGLGLDFGPSNIAHVVKFIEITDSLLSNNSKICLTSYLNSNQTNTCFLLGSYIMIKQHMSPSDAFRIIKPVAIQLAAFRDAGSGPGSPPFILLIQDCLKGLHRAIRHRIIDIQHFDITSYEHYERVENGDMNWIVPGKILAMAGPNPSRFAQLQKIASSENRQGFGFPQLLKYFNEKRVQTVVRLNYGVYESSIFENQGIKHVNLYFPDCTVPHMRILYRFLEIMNSSHGAVAVHCKAGVGRTGTLICGYLMKEYRFSAMEAIGFLRIMRPGSVVGCQQDFLISIESEMHAIGEQQHGRRSPMSYPQVVIPVLNKKISRSTVSAS